MTVVSFDASLLVDRACLAALHATDPAAASQANAFAAHMLGAFRVENVLGMYLYALLSAALAYASSVPTPATRVGVALYWLWNLCYLAQVVCAAAVVAILGMSAAELIALLDSCAAPLDGVKVGLAGGFGIFALILFFFYESPRCDSDTWGLTPAVAAICAICISRN